MKKILFPTDFSDRANKALAQAIFYAKLFNAEIIIYHAYHRPIGQEGNPDQIAHALHAYEKGIDKQFQKLQHDNAVLEKVKHEFRKELGVSIENIPHVAKSEEVDLIIMATKGANGFDELWGTKTATIVKKVELPVLVIPDHATLNNIGKVGLVCDYSKNTAYQGLDFLVEIIKEQALDIDVITLNRSELPMKSEEQTYRMLVRKKFESIPTTFHFTFDSSVDEGIIDYSKANGIGMIAILQKSYGFIKQIFHESLSERMIFRSPIPLLVLK
jgi:nucleotide-binding universal stress UspA family protein